MSWFYFFSRVRVAVPGLERDAVLGRERFAVEGRELLGVLLYELCLCSPKPTFNGKKVPS